MLFGSPEIPSKILIAIEIAKDAMVAIAGLAE